MKNRLRKGFSALVVLSLFVTCLYTEAWAEDRWTRDDPITDEWNMIDLLVARPIGIAAGIIGTAAFVLSLPFTIPTSSHDEAAETFVARPFSFSFCREFPDENM